MGNVNKLRISMKEINAKAILLGLFIAKRIALPRQGLHFGRKNIFDKIQSAVGAIYYAVPTALWIF